MDIDSDGDLDLLVGDKYESVHFYERQGDGSLIKKDPLVTLEAPDNSTPEIPLTYMSISMDVVDWNEDGLLDIILGADWAKTGKPFPLRLYKNRGTATSPAFSDYKVVSTKDGAAIQADCGRVDVVDINLDGIKDLIVSDKKVNVTYYRNVATNENPQFEKSGEKLVGSETFGIPVKPDFGQNAGFGYGTARVFDWNQDGLPDLLLSGYTIGKVLVYFNDAQ